MPRVVRTVARGLDRAGPMEEASPTSSDVSGMYEEERLRNEPGRRSFLRSGTPHPTCRLETTEPKGILVTLSLPLC